MHFVKWLFASRIELFQGFLQSLSKTKVGLYLWIYSFHILLPSAICPPLTPSQIPHWPSLFCLIFFLLSKHVIFAWVKGAFNLNTESVPSCHIQLKMFLSILRHLSMLLERAHKLFFFTGKAHSTGIQHCRYWCGQSPSRVQLFVTPWTAARRVPLFMGFSSHQYWNGLPFPSPGHLPDPGIEPGSPV